MLRCFLKITKHVPKHNQRNLTPTSSSLSHHSNQFTKASSSNNTTLSYFTSSSTTGEGGNGKNTKEEPDDDDPFGIKENNDNTKLPPKYKRDPITGKFTGEEEKELTDEEDKLLNNMSDEEILGLIEGRVISKNDWDEDDIAHDVRAKDSALNVLGRKVMQDKDNDDDNDKVSVSSSTPLSTSEFEGFKDYLRKEEDTYITKKDIDIDEETTSTQHHKTTTTDQDLSWIAKSSTKDKWLEEIMPYDLAPQKKVNRRDAKPIPKKLLHHNNIELLRRYSTPGGQILPRAQSRLGAKDQRKIAKLIKRSRALGIIPNIGQWKLEDTGAVEGGKERFWWEDELEKKGLSLPTKFSDMHRLK